MSEFPIKFTKKQSKAWDAMQDKSVDELLYGGAKGGGKSIFGCFWSYLTAYEIARQNIPEPLANPVVVGFMGRKIAKDFKDTTLETWRMFIPEDRYEIKGDPPNIVIAGRVKIMTGGLDRREDINKFNSAAFGLAFIDQAEETVEDDIRLLRAATHNRLVINQKRISGKVVWTANPAKCWLKDQFIDEHKPNRVYIEALPSDNPYLGEDYIETLKETFEDRPELLQAYLYGSWDVLEGFDQIIKSEWLKHAASQTIYGEEIKKLLCCDTARFGDDETVIYYLENTEIMDEEIMPHCRTTDISTKLAEMSANHDDCICVVESTGADLGAGVIDELVKMKKNVLQFNPEAKSGQPDKFWNQRAEAWLGAARKFAKGQIQLKNADKTLKNQLCVPCYKFKVGKMVVEPKEEIKKRLKRSPDRADAYIIGLWGLDRIRSQPKRFQRSSYQTNLAESYAVESVL